MRIIFWFSIFFIIYAYAGYPVVLYVCCLFTKLPRAKHGDPFLPKMSLLISAYNEEKVIREKLINSLNLDYPRELFEVIVVSDASDDMTESVVEEYKALGVALHHYEGHIGKTACLNRTIPRTNGEIIVFSDANSQYDRHALRGLAEGFVDESVGCVTGWTEYVGSNEQSPGLYARLEMLVKDLESKIGSCVGADGAIFAIRKNLFVPLKDYDINDLVIPLNIVRQGYRVVLGKGIYCLEDSAGSSKKEFTRQTRITARTLRALFNFSDLFNFFKYPLFAFQIISHKLLKFMVPYFLILVTLSSAYLTIRGDAWLYSSAFLILTCCYLFWWIGYRGIKVPLISRIVSITQMFLTFNLAIAIGWIKYLQGETFTTWKTAR